jgi:hypothetical protein
LEADFFGGGFGGGFYLDSSDWDSADFDWIPNINNFRVLFYVPYGTIVPVRKIEKYKLFDV